ncbi:MAG: porin [Gammaproteobacteria bacterium]|nr:porin [Gammaproteobacteria bacterium]MBU2060014.1 porin [Gammaproteobacteria bacterium]MBU2174173.1 porin [Gammaproteobacteria bacterium]MBU2248356.1 porin [Gammaproteobacteria bacterium]MBU2346242.1 porin [Gammaproteobacteria bacterium]
MLTKKPLASLIALAIAGLCSQAQAAVTFGDTELTYGGYIKLDTMWTDTSDGQIATGIGRDFYIPSLTPVGGEGESATFDTHARQSRFFFKTATTLDNGKKVTGMIEFDMMSTPIGDERISNGYAPEIRHAFLSYENWLMGQTWSTFMDVASLPDSLDFVGNTDGAIFNRQAQIRYTNGGWQVALENPETTVTPNGGGARIVTDDNSVPDVVVKYHHAASWGSVALAVMARQLSIESAGLDDSTNGYAVSLSGKYNISATDDIRFTINSGEGLGRYIGLNTSNDAVLDAAGKLDAIKVTGYALAYKHAWADKWRSSLIYSAQHIDNDAQLTGLAVTDNTSSYAVNLIYQAASKLMFGVELRHATREILSGDEGDLNRVQFSAKYDF